MEHVKCLIIGSGPAGYTAAIYTSRANLHPVEYSGMQPGGQLTQTTEVENFPGYPQGVDGNQMMMDLREQAERFGADIRDGSITKVDFSTRPYKLWDEENNERHHCNRSICQISGTGRRTQIQRTRRLCLCHLRRLLLPQENRSSGRRWRYSLRGRALPERTGQEGLSDCPQAFPACL